MENLKIILNQNEVESYLKLSDKILSESKQLTVESDNDIAVATDFVKGLKTIEKEIVGYFKEPKQTARKVHQTITGTEKKVLEPLKQADANVRQLIIDYENKKREIMREMLEQEQEERERKAELLLEEAEKDRANGDEFTGIVKEETALNLLETPEIKTEKVENLSVIKTWKARVVDEIAVPVEVNGVEIRPVDMKALNKLAKATKGKMKIEGVEFYEETSTRIY